MTILTSNKAPVGIRGLSVFLIGIGALYVTAFVGLNLLVFQIDGGIYNFEPITFEQYLISPLLQFGLPGAFALSSAAALFSERKIARILLILYGVTALTGFQGIISGHPIFLFGIIGAITLYYIWKPHVREYFQQL